MPISEIRLGFFNRKFARDDSKTCFYMLLPLHFLILFDSLFLRALFVGYLAKSTRLDSECEKWNTTHEIFEATLLSLEDKSPWLQRRSFLLQLALMDRSAHGAPLHHTRGLP